MRFVGVPLDADFDARRDGDARRDRARPPGARLHRLPEQPDRQPVRRRDVERDRRARRRGWSSVDEAYQPFADAHFAAALLDFPNSWSMRTVSKSAWPACASATRSAPPRLDRAVRQAAAAVQRERADAGGDAVRCSRTPTCSRDQAAAIRAERDAARSARWRRCPACSAFPSAGQLRPGARARRRAGFDGAAGARRPGQERRRAASAARQLPAHHGRHAGRERRAARRARSASSCADEPDAMNAPMRHDPSAAPTVERDTAETQIRVSVDLDGTGAPKLRPASRFLDHMLDQVARHGADRPRRSRPRATCTSTAHHTVEDIGITLGQAVATGARRQEGHPPLRPRLRAARRGAVARRHRLLRAARGSNCTCRSRARMIGDVRRRPDPRVLPGLRQPRAGDAAHRQPARRQRAPPGGDGVQGVRPRAAHGARARSARGGRDPVDQGKP